MFFFFRGRFFIAAERGGSYPLSFRSIENGSGTVLELFRKRSINPDGSGTVPERVRNGSRSVPGPFGFSFGSNRQGRGPTPFVGHDLTCRWEDFQDMLAPRIAFVAYAFKSVIHEIGHECVFNSG